MSKSTLSKASAVLVGLSMLVATATSALAVDSTPSAIKILRNQAASKTAILKEKLEVRRQNIQEKLASIQERIASREAGLKLKLQTFKDQTKAKIAERVNSLLNKINQNQTSRMDKHLDNMSDILKRLENRVDNNTPDIKDADAAREAIASASAAIAAASDAVSTQSEKVYTIEVTSEGRIAADAKIQRDNLHTDLTAVRKLVREAKKALINAIRTTKGTAALKDKEATESGQ